MKKEYKVNSRNSTVNGSPGRDFDWSKFDWEGQQIHKDTCLHGHTEERKAPPAYVDDCLIAPNCQYLHVPYEWEELCTIYRVRPNDTMYAGEVYRGHLIKKQTAIKKEDGWYWVLWIKRD